MLAVLRVSDDLKRDRGFPFPISLWGGCLGRLSRYAYLLHTIPQARAKIWARNGHKGLTGGVPAFGNHFCFLGFLKFALKRRRLRASAALKGRARALNVGTYVKLCLTEPKAFHRQAAEHLLLLKPASRGPPA